MLQHSLIKNTSKFHTETSAQRVLAEGQRAMETQATEKTHLSGQRPLASEANNVLTV